MSRRQLTCLKSGWLSCHFGISCFDSASRRHIGLTINGAETLWMSRDDFFNNSRSSSCKSSIHIISIQWSLLNRFRTEQGHCGACRRKWQLTDTDLCPCGETQTTSHIVESCPLTKLNGGLSRLHSADEVAVSWLTNYGKWHAYEKKKKNTNLARLLTATQ